MPEFTAILKGTCNVLDPMAGTGKLVLIKDYGYSGDVYLNELEPEWAWQAAGKAKGITVANAMDLPYRDGFFEAVCTSPTYGNRMADHHNARDDSRRNTYRHTLGRELAPLNTGGMQWGDNYRMVHAEIWQECRRVLAPGGLLILNISDHIRKGEVVQVTDWHTECLTGLGFALQEHRKIPTPRNRFGANGGLRVEHESILVFKSLAQVR